MTSREQRRVLGSKIELNIIDEISKLYMLTIGLEKRVKKLESQKNILKKFKDFIIFKVSNKNA